MQEKTPSTKCNNQRRAEYAFIVDEIRRRNVNHTKGVIASRLGIGPACLSKRCSGKQVVTVEALFALRWVNTLLAAEDIGVEDEVDEVDELLEGIL